MTPYISCDYARPRLEGLVDRELPLDEQVAVESHVRWCDTCAARIEDLQLIGSSIRHLVPSKRARARVKATWGDDADWAPIGDALSGVLMRVHAEQDQTLAARVREQFADARLLWPAVGATLAVLLLVGIAVGMLHYASIQRPESLASVLEAMRIQPGTEGNPMRPDNVAGGVSMPSVVSVDLGFERLGYEEAMFTVGALVDREGSIADYTLLGSVGAWDEDVSVHDGHVEFVLDAVRQAKFVPAQTLTPIGRPVAVNMVWLIVNTRVETSDPGPGLLMMLPAGAVGGSLPAVPGGAVDEPAGTPAAGGSPTA